LSTASRLRRERAKQRAAGNATPTSGARKPRRAPTFTARLRYAFDSSMSSGPNALIWYLGAAVLVIVVLFATLILIFGAGPTHNPITALYDVTLHTIDTGTQANDTGTSYQVLDLIVTLSGIFIFSAFIGVLANSIDSRLSDLRKGRSAVLERDHTLVLGWSDSIFTVISELSIANESLTKASIVILADKDKVEMEDAIRDHVPELRGTKVVCRTGDPIVVGDLELVNHHDARSVIVLAPEGDDPDAMVIKTVLALTRGPGRREHPYHVVAEIQDPRNLDAAQLAGGEETVVLDKSITVSRLIVQTSRQSGAAFVYQELLDFDGDEIYMRADPRLDGKTYGEALFAYENCTVIGIRTEVGGVTLNPSADTVLSGGDQIVAIAEDDSVLEVAEPLQGTIDEHAIMLNGDHPDPPESTLVLGYNRRTAAVIAELDEYAQPGSRVDVVALAPPTEEQFLKAVGAHRNLEISVRPGDTADRAVLDGLAIADADRVIVMCDSEAFARKHADARVLVTLLHLRDIAEQSGADFTIVSEILDEADRELARVANVDDIIVSEQVISYLLAQISENRDLAEVFEELFAAEGSEVYMRPVAAYVNGGGAAVSFATLVEAARRRGETAIGYRIAAQSSQSESAFGVRVNPVKSELFEPAEADRLIVLAED
jgi:voltage-gated potassium channel Kch